MAFVIASIGFCFPGCGADPRMVPDQPDAAGSDSPPPDAPGSGTTALALPLTISDYFIPGGYMGDGETSPTAIVVNTTACKQPRPAGATGDCYRVTFTPGSKGWAGVYWQYPLKNWGANPGKKVEAGATKVTFYAAGAAGGEPLQFIAGGVNDPTLPYHDSFKVATLATLTTALAPYQIDLSGHAYDSGVLGAFAWTVAAPTGSATPIQFYLDSIRWEK